MPPAAEKALAELTDVTETEPTPEPHDPERSDPGAEYPDCPQVAVGVVVWQGPNMLLTRRSAPPLEGQWALPGAGQRLGETVFQCARREILQSTGLIIEPTGIVTVSDEIEPDVDGRIRNHYTQIIVTALCETGTPVALLDAAESRFVPPEDAEALVIHDPLKAIIRLAVAHRLTEATHKVVRRD
ncbi:MAG: hypothetical protein Alpg2KO_18130 [Alphaproteobacteria bacterium]